MQLKNKKKVCNITILAGLPLVAPGAVACVVADADSCVFARRFALRFGVENEPERDAPRRVRARGANADKSHQHHGGPEHRWTGTRRTHVWSGFVSQLGRGRSGRTVRWTEMEEKYRGLSTSPPLLLLLTGGTTARLEPGGAGGEPGGGSVLVWGQADLAVVAAW